MLTPLSPRDQNEVARSASKARKLVIEPVRTERYMNPSPSTPFALEYAFCLLADVKGKVVLDLGCGSGEELIPLVLRGAEVIGIDISPDLISLAKRRLIETRPSAMARVGSAYETELPDASVDAIFCMSLLHHLDIPRVREEMRRILRPGGFVIVKEPIRFSKTYGFLRSILPAHDDVSDYEHPLTEQEFREVQQGFDVDGLRFFRLPIVPLAGRMFPVLQRGATLISAWSLATFPATAQYATETVFRMLRRQHQFPFRATTGANG